MTMTLTRLSRDEFLREYWAYEPGEHVAIAQPTGGGKSLWMYQLLRETMKTWGGHLSFRVTVPKRRDETAGTWNTALGLRETAIWPPVPNPFRGRPPGWALWPRHLDGQPGQDPRQVLAANRDHLQRHLMACAQDAYQTGKSVYVADDIYHQAVVLEMNEFFSEMLTQGRAMECGLWGCNQKPSGTKDGSVTSFFWNQPTHYFFGYDGDKRNRDRFGEIGGVDPRYVSEVVMGLPVHNIGGHNVSEQLYISKAGSDGHGGPAMCVVGI
jgi:hypothetical protein